MQTQKAKTMFNKDRRGWKSKLKNKHAYIYTHLIFSGKKSKEKLLEFVTFKNNFNYFKNKFLIKIFINFGKTKNMRFFILLTVCFDFLHTISPHNKHLIIKLVFQL